MASVEAEFGDRGTQSDDCFPKAFPLVELEESKGHFRKPKAVQRAIPGEHSKDNEAILPICICCFLLVDTEVKRSDMLKCPTSDELDALLEALDGVEREVAAEAREGVTKLARCLGTGT